MDKRLARSIGSGARAARTEANLTQAQVAEAVGIATEVYGRLERGLMLPSVETLLKLCRALGASSDSLLGLDTADPSVFVAPPLIPARRPEIQRLLSRAEKLERRQVRLVSTLAMLLEKPGKGPAKAG